MQAITIDGKKYIIIEQKVFERLQKIAGRKAKPVKVMSLARAKKYAYKLTDDWAKEK